LPLSSSALGEDTDFGAPFVRVVTRNGRDGDEFLNAMRLAEKAFSGEW